MNGLGEAPDAAAQIAGLIFAVVLVDPDHRIAQANLAAEEMLGRSAARLAGTPLFDVLAIDEERVRESLLGADTQLIARGIVVETAQRDRRVNLTSSPLPSHPCCRRR